MTMRAKGAHSSSIEGAFLPGGMAAPGTSRTRFPFICWLLAPATTWQARRVVAKYGHRTDARTAWVIARLERHPEESVYVTHRLSGQRKAF